MWGTRRTRRALIAAAAMITGAVVVSAASPATAQDDEPVVLEEDYGILRLRVTGSTSTVTLTREGSPDVTQTFNVNNQCGASTSGNLLAVTAGGGDAPQRPLGISGPDMGVRDKNNCATDSARVDAGESITFALATGANAVIPGTVSIVSVELDVEGKQNADLAYSLDGTPAAEPYELGRAASDNGPDSGLGDNDRARITGAFRSITVSPTGGSISLLGGGDGSFGEYQKAGLIGPLGAELETSDTIFELAMTQEFDEAVFCNDDPIAAIGGGDGQFADFKRYSNDGDPDDSDCEDIPVSFEILDTGEVLLTKSTQGIETGAEQAVNALVEIVWAPQEATVPLPAREITLNPDDPEPVWKDVEWCADVDWTDVWPPDPNDPYEPPPLIDLDTDPLPPIEHPEGVPWCLVSERVVMVPGGEDGDAMVQQIQVYHGSGDPMWK